MARRTAWILPAGFATFVLAALYSWLVPANLHDETWFLQVVNRVVTGDTLYRDVAFGATPLSVYVSGAFVSMFGVELLVIRGVVCLCFVVSLLACLATARRLDFGGGRAAACGAALFLYVLPGMVKMSAAYTPMAIACMLVCLACTLAAAGGNYRAALLAGIAAALCFASKQNMGVYALVALLGALWFGGRTRWSGHVLVVFVAATGALMLPVLLSGGTSGLLDYGFLGKGAYVRLGRISYLSQLGAAPAALFHPSSFSELYWNHQYVLQGLALVAIAWAVLARRQRDPRTITVVLFAGAGFASVLPRADEAHLPTANAFLIIAVLHLLPALFAQAGPRSVRLARRLAFGWLFVGLAAIAYGTAARTASTQFMRSALPHLRGVLVGREALQASGPAIATLRAGAQDGMLFILSPAAGFYYLASGLQNPTPYDYPLVTTFGRRGEEETVRAIRNGRIAAACIDSSPASALRPVMVEQAIRRHMQAVLRTGPCPVFRRL